MGRLTGLIAALGAATMAMLWRLRARGVAWRTTGALRQAGAAAGCTVTGAHELVAQTRAFRAAIELDLRRCVAGPARPIPADVAERFDAALRSISPRTRRAMIRRGARDVLARVAERRHAPVGRAPARALLMDLRRLEAALTLRTGS